LVVAFATSICRLQTTGIEPTFSTPNVIARKWRKVHYLLPVHYMCRTRKVPSIICSSLSPKVAFGLLLRTARCCFLLGTDFRTPQHFLYRRPLPQLQGPFGFCLVARGDDDVDSVDRSFMSASGSLTEVVQVSVGDARSSSISLSIASVVSAAVTAEIGLGTSAESCCTGSTM
jgi:hypothetical protein